MIKILFFIVQSIALICPYSLLCMEEDLYAMFLPSLMTIVGNSLKEETISTSNNNNLQGQSNTETQESQSKKQFLSLAHLACTESIALLSDLAIMITEQSQTIYTDAILN